MTPEEAKIWIENEVAERFPFGSSSCLIKRRAATETATSLYQHLQENGRVAELEKEVERLKGLIKDLWLKANTFGHTHSDWAERYWENYKTENNL